MSEPHVSPIPPFEPRPEPEDPLQAELRGVRESQARAERDVRHLRGRTGWILAFAVLALFGSCDSRDRALEPDQQLRQDVVKLQEQVTGLSEQNEQLRRAIEQSRTAQRPAAQPSAAPTR
ncbi:hypothetical protein [Agilicoccus flavus]|uniref:hypothetical protein n=1 Tax=Agilicoccus flavus TaxID=2775968 RepID=UPI001CF65B31|nr:hypothetical protein [Agilicoccus flavus]